MRHAITTETRLSSRRARLAQQILAYVREHDLPAGHHLTEDGLATVFQVSRSPIRAALHLLRSQGVVVAKPNQGYFLARNGRTFNSVDIDVPPTKEEALYARIIDAHVSGRLGAVMNQVDLMREFGVSRNVVERTLARLADEGLMERSAGQGWTFLPSLNTAEARHDSYQIRLALEPAGILLPQFRIDKDALERSRLDHLSYLSKAGRKQSEGSRRYKIDASFHEMLAGFTRNSFFVQAIQQQNRLRHLLEYRGYVSRERVTEWCEEHLAIIDALSKGQRKKASLLLRQHLIQASTDAQRVGAGGHRGQ